jgi:carbon storage regulator CsrA
MEETVMLVLSRKVGEDICIDGQIKVTVVKIGGNRVKIGIDAPDDVQIVRKELNEWHGLSFDVPQPPESTVDQTCTVTLDQ